MPAAGTFGVEGAQAATGGGGDGVLDEAALVEGVAVDRDLGVGLVRDVQAAVDRRRRGAPVLVQLEADRTGLDLLAQGLGAARIALAMNSFS